MTTLNIPTLYEFYGTRTFLSIPVAVSFANPFVRIDHPAVGTQLSTGGTHTFTGVATDFNINGLPVDNVYLDFFVNRPGDGLVAVPGLQKVPVALVDNNWTHDVDFSDYPDSFDLDFADYIRVFAHNSPDGRYESDSRTYELSGEPDFGFNPDDPIDFGNVPVDNPTPSQSVMAFTVFTPPWAGEGIEVFFDVDTAGFEISFEQINWFGEGDRLVWDSYYPSRETRIYVRINHDTAETINGLLRFRYTDGIAVNNAAVLSLSAIVAVPGLSIAGPDTRNLGAYVWNDDTMYSHVAISPPAFYTQIVLTTPFDMLGVTLDTNSEFHLLSLPGPLPLLKDGTTYFLPPITGGSPMVLNLRVSFPEELIEQPVTFTEETANLVASQEGVTLATVELTSRCYPYAVQIQDITPNPSVDGAWAGVGTSGNFNIATNDGFWQDFSENNGADFAALSPANKRLFWRITTEHNNILIRTPGGEWVSPQFFSNYNGAVAGQRWFLPDTVTPIGDRVTVRPMEFRWPNTNPPDKVVEMKVALSYSRVIDAVLDFFEYDGDVFVQQLAVDDSLFMMAKFGHEYHDFLSFTATPPTYPSFFYFFQNDTGTWTYNNVTAEFTDTGSPPAEPSKNRYSRYTGLIPVPYQHGGANFAAGFETGNIIFHTTPYVFSSNKSFIYAATSLAGAELEIINNGFFDSAPAKLRNYPLHVEISECAEYPDLSEQATEQRYRYAKQFIQIEADGATAHSQALRFKVQGKMFRLDPTTRNWTTPIYDEIAINGIIIKAGELIVITGALP